MGPIREQQRGLDVNAHAFFQLIGSDAAEALSTTRSIVATGHVALVGDLISWTSGSLDTKEYRVVAVATNAITVCEAMSVAPTAADTFDILRQKAPVLGGDGSLGVSFTNDTNYGAVGATTLRTASQVGNATGAADFGSGAAGAQTLRTVLATRHEAAATPVATRPGNGTAFAAFGAGANAADVPRTTPATDAPHLLATRHEAVATPLAAQLTNGSAAVAYDSGAAGATVLRTVLATRHEAVATPLAVQISNGSAATDMGAGAAASTTPRVVTSKTNIAYTAKGNIAGTALTGSYATLLDATTDLLILHFFNSCNTTILVSMDGGTTDSFELEAGESFSLDLGSNGMKHSNAVNISAKHAGAVPTAGTIRCSGVG